MKTYSICYGIETKSVKPVFVPRNYTKTATDLHHLFHAPTPDFLASTPNFHGPTPEFPRAYTAALAGRGAADFHGPTPLLGRQCIPKHFLFPALVYDDWC